MKKMLLSQNSVSQPEKFKPKALTMENIIDLWLDSKHNQVKTSTLAYYKRTCNKLLKPLWSVYSPHKLPGDILIRLADALREKYSSKYIKDISIMAKQILAFAFEQEYAKPFAIKNAKIPVKRARPVVMSVLEQRKLTSFLLNKTDLSKTGILLTLYTGLRLGELCGLRWSDVDLMNGNISVKRTIQRLDSDFLIDSPKTFSSERTIPLPSFIAELMRNIEPENKEYYVTTGSNGFTQPRTYQNRFKAYLKECELPDYHFHTLRHTFASRAIELGIDPKSVSEILGHANVKITLDLYVHPSMEAKKEQMEKFSSFFEQKTAIKKVTPFTKE